MLYAIAMGQTTKTKTCTAGKRNLELRCDNDKMSSILTKSW